MSLTNNHNAAMLPKRQSPTLCLEPGVQSGYETLDHLQIVGGLGGGLGQPLQGLCHGGLSSHVEVTHGRKAVKVKKDQNPKGASVCWWWSNMVLVARLIWLVKDWIGWWWSNEPLIGLFGWSSVNALSCHGGSVLGGVQMRFLRLVCLWV